MRALPSGTVTFLFTDVEGSTRLTTVRMSLHTGEPRVTEEGMSAARCTEPRASPPPGEEEAIPEQTLRARECSPGEFEAGCYRFGAVI
jgi:hypothetical protein